jgi:hypothetical protein
MQPPKASLVPRHTVELGMAQYRRQGAGVVTLKVGKGNPSSLCLNPEMAAD